MCFSAAASYTASAALLLTGAIAMSKAKPRMRMLAAIPLLFSAQQFLEGITWQALSKGESALMSTYAYLVFVFLVWPLWMPLAVRSLSTKKREIALLNIPIAAGGFVAILALVCIFYITPLAAITCNSIQYFTDLPPYAWKIGTIAYLTATIPPFFIVKQRYLWLMGATLAISYAISFIFYYPILLSIWCFFAALLSLLILLLVW